MASIRCRNGETFPASHTHLSVAEVRQCQGAASSWKAERPASLNHTNEPCQVQPYQGRQEQRDARNVYLNPRGVPAQLSAFDGSKLGVTTAEALAGAEQVAKELGKFATRTHPSNRVDPELEAKVPDGRYAIIDQLGVVKFYRVRKVTKGTWAGRTFVDRQASDEEFPVRFAGERAKILAAIATNVKAAAVRYGMELGACSQCGRTLTNPESIAAGIGPVCLARL